MTKTLLFRFIRSWFITTTLLYLACIAAAETDPFSMIVIADFHGAETFSYNPDTDTNQFYQNYKSTLSHIRETYGGDVVLIPGDSNEGRWFEQYYIQQHFNGKSPSEAVYQAGINCYSTLRKLFNQAGYNKLFMAIGDHELGDNGWFVSKIVKTNVQKDFRQSFRDGFNTNKTDGSFYYNGIFKYENLEVPSTPWGTDHEKLSYAYQFKNVLIVTIDIYEQAATNTNYFDRQNGRGGEGTVTGNMSGVHLAWFEKVLKIAKHDSSGIKHIIVQSHLPIKGPVRKVQSSVMNVDDGVYSELWKLMVTYNVDVYLAGEVHSTTAIKDNKSNLVQIVSRGNRLNNFLKIVVKDDKLHIRHYKEVGSKPQNNNKYEKNGELVIHKSGTTRKIISTGALRLINSKKELLRYDFEEMVPLVSRQVTGLYQRNGEEFISIIANSTIIRGITSTLSMPNLGAFGRK